MALTTTQQAAALGAPKPGSPLAVQQALAESTRVAQEAAKMIGGTFTQGSYGTGGQVMGGFTPAPTPQAPQQAQMQQLSQPMAAPQAPPAYQYQPFQAPQSTQADQDISAIRNQLSSLQKQYTDSLQASPDQTQTQEQLNQLIASTRLGVANTQNQAIAMPFITGQQRAIESRAAALSEPLTSKLALLQQQRESQQKALDAQLGFAESGLDMATKARESALDRALREYELNEGARRFGYEQQVGQQTFAEQQRQFNIAQQNKSLEQKQNDYGPGTIGEYQFYTEQEKAAGRTPISYNEYQNLDANRKAQIARAGSGGLTPYQTNQAFINISSKYQADQIANQAVNGQTAVNIADQIIANPQSATSQLASLYLLVKNLDPTSAVREGELALANQTQSYLQQFGNILARVNEGRVISPDAAKQLAIATKALAGAWNSTATRRQQQYQSQANIAGVGDQFRSYLGGYPSNFNTGGTTLGTTGVAPTTSGGGYSDYLKSIGH